MLQKLQSNFGVILAGVFTLYMVIRLIKDMKRSSKLLAAVVNLAMLYMNARKEKAISA